MVPSKMIKFIEKLKETNSEHAKNIEQRHNYHLGKHSCSRCQGRNVDTSVTSNVSSSSTTANELKNTNEGRMNIKIMLNFIILLELKIPIEFVKGFLPICVNVL